VIGAKNPILIVSCAFAVIVMNIRSANTIISSTNLFISNFLLSETWGGETD